MTPKNTETNREPGSPRSDRTDDFGPDSRPASPDSTRTDYFGPDSRPASPDSTRTDYFSTDSGISSDDCCSDDESTGGPMTVAPPPVEPVNLAKFFATWRFRTFFVFGRRW